jgi:hypothetical protein
MQEYEVNKNLDFYLKFYTVCERDPATGACDRIIQDGIKETEELKLKLERMKLDVNKTLNDPEKTKYDAKKSRLNRISMSEIIGIDDE